MLAMFRKQLRATWVVAAVFALLGHEMSRLDFARPSYVGWFLNWQFAVIAFALGTLVAHNGFHLERTRRTQLYWMHRGLSARRIFLSKAAADLCALAVGWAIGVAIAHVRFRGAVIGSMTPTEFIAGHAGMLMASAGALGGHALGSVCAQLPRSTLLRLGVNFFAGIGQFVLLAGLATLFPTRWLEQGASWLLWNVALAALLYPIGAKLMASGTDDDRPLPGRLRIAVNVALLVFLAPFGALFAWGLGMSVSIAAWSRRPDHAAKIETLDHLDDPTYSSTGRYRLEITEVDVLSARRVVRDEQANDAIVADERLHVSPAAYATVLAAALVTPPSFSLYEHLTPAPLDNRLRNLAELSPCAGGKRTWILFLVLTFSLFVANQMTRRRALGLRWSWFAIVLAAGPAVLVIAPLLEPSPRRTPAARPPRSPLRPRIAGRLASEPARA